MKKKDTLYNSLELKQQMKTTFHVALSEFADNLGKHILNDGEWTIKGFIDVFKNIYIISADTKVISKILELHILPHFLNFANQIGYRLELATHQNWYPDLTFIHKKNNEIKFAVDLKTTYIEEKRPEYCNGFTLGSHGEYFINRDSSKNVQYSYNSYCSHFCLCIIYSRALLNESLATGKYTMNNLSKIPSVIKNFTIFAEEKWKLASDKRGSGNTANIGSIKRIADMLSGNGVFAKAGEEIFNDYWANYGKIMVKNKDGKLKPMTSFDEYIEYRGLSLDIKNKIVGKINA